MKVLHVIPSLECNAAAKQLSLLGTGLPPQYQMTVCVLGSDGPCARRLRSAGLPMRILGWTRRFDPRAVWRLRRIVQELRPDLIHCWQSGALRALSLSISGRRIPVVVSHPLVARRRPSPPDRLDRWLLRRTARIVASGAAEASRCQQFGLTTGKIDVMPPGVEECRPLAPRAASTHGASGLHSGPVILCAGALQPYKGFYDAIWTFDILRFVFPELQLVIAGDGPERGRLEKLATGAKTRAQVHFVGARAQISDLLAGADLVWVPSLAETGLNVALEALAAGKPVIASRLPGLAEIIVDGHTGFLVAPGDKPSLARRTRTLVLDPGLGRQLGEAGRQHVLRHFSVAELVRGWCARYDELAA
jgi:glycosyltransferase involved in cell wall biosynthesis